MFNVFHVSLLQKDKPRRSEFKESEGWVPISEEEIENDMDSYEIECILSHRGEGPSLKFLVKWKGWSQNDATWVPAAEVKAPKLVRLFKGSLTREQRKRQRKNQEL